jgi:hypothetical protein
LVDGKPTRTAGAPRRGAEAVRQHPWSLVAGLAREPLIDDVNLATKASARPRLRLGTSSPSTTPSCADSVSVNTWQSKVMDLMKEGMSLSLSARGCAMIGRVLPGHS